MEQTKVAEAKLVADQIKEYVHNNPRLCALFTVQPKLSIDVYEKTSIFYATSEYEANIADQIIPHGFFQILYDEVNEKGLLETLKKYNQELTIIAETTNTNLLKIRKLITKLRKKMHEQLDEKCEREDAAKELQEIIRKGIAKYKENYISKVRSQKSEELKAHTQIKDTPQKDVFKPEECIKIIMATETTKKAIETIIYSSFGIPSTDYDLEELLRATFIKKNIPNYDLREEMAKVLHLEKPASYSSFSQNRDIKSLEDKYEPLLNNRFKLYPEVKRNAIYLLIRLIYKQKINPEGISEKEEQEIIRYKQIISQGDQALIEEITVLMRQTKTTIKYENGIFSFNLPPKLSQEEYKECREYSKKLKKLKNIHNKIFKYYQNQAKIINSFVSKADVEIPSDENYTIDITYWLSFTKIQSLIDKIDLNKLESLSQNDFEELRLLLVEKGLLWAYIAGNIDVDITSKIINNFEAIITTLKKENLNIDNIENIIKTANINDYASDLLIGLVGLENATKIINYNQFVGVKVTKEHIEARIRKVIDLAVRSESIRTSSLPFTCEAAINNLKVVRYPNNDPDIFSSGIDTKTCFFVSVNENDFFFYSLLNKNGCVLKIVNSQNELIARASCFRRNNVFMINGIRLRNNKTIAENEEDLKEFQQITKLIETYAQKLIEITANDECPIKYVVCNKVGILELDELSSRFEMVNHLLFREPINRFDEDWQEFVSLYDGKEQLLQEVPYSKDKCFVTDFGDNYPVLLIASKNNAGLLSPLDISQNDQYAKYQRPRKEVKTYLNAEINSKILEQINRIRALNCFTGTPEEQEIKQKKFKLLKNIAFIKSITIGEDWFIITTISDEYIRVFATDDSKPAYEEARKAIEQLSPSVETDTKIYIPTRNIPKK